MDRPYHHPQPFAGVKSAVVVDEWALFRRGVIAVLEAMDVKVTGEAEGYEDARLHVWSSAPDLVVVGRPSAGSLPDLVRTVKGQHPDTCVLALVSGSRADELRAVLSSGADGVLARAASPAELEGALGQVLAGKRVLAAAALSVLVGRVEPTSTTPGAASLTAKELQVLALLGRGMANREIAETLVLSMATVKSHLGRIYGKLGATNRREAVGKAIEAGLLA